MLLAAGLLLLIARILYRWRASVKYSIYRIPGPKRASWTYGNFLELMQGEAAEAELKWTSKFGSVVRVPSPLGKDDILISDPKALQYIFHTSSYRWPKAPERRTISFLVTGNGLTQTEGDTHKRQRKIMLPAFATPEMKAFVPIFSFYVSKLCSLWRDDLSETEGGSKTVDIPSSISKATLDSIGNAAFDYNFGTLEESGNELAASYMNVLFDMLSSISPGVILYIGIARLIPFSLIKMFLTRSKSPRVVHARRTSELATGVARQLVDEKKAALEQGKGKKDIMTLLVQANESEDPKTRLDEDELFAQMRTIMFAGHETTASTLNWVLLELCIQPLFQSRLREEIRAFQRKRKRALTATDFESEELSYLSAVVKESLRYHPVIFSLFRMAGNDDVVPLSYPLTLTDGTVVNEITVKKGQRIIASLAAYNRDTTLFGADANEFNPERWFNDTCTSKIAESNIVLGLYSNLLTFSAGVRGCIGWRFAVYELRAFLFELISNFEFSLSPECGGPTADKIRREACGIMSPAIQGEVEKGVQLPLRIRIAK